MVFVDVLPDFLSLTRACILIETEMNAAIHARIIDVLGDVTEGAIGECHAGNARTGKDDGIAVLAEDVLGYAPRRVARGGMSGWVSRKTRGGDEWHKRRIRLRLIVAVHVARVN